MSLVVVKCPQCGAELNTVDDRDFMFCSYCGSKVTFEKQLVEISGTITDFMQPEIEDMLNTLENFNDLGVQIISRLEPDYEIKEYRKSIRLADRIARKRLGLKPV